MGGLKQRCVLDTKPPWLTFIVNNIKIILTISEANRHVCIIAITSKGDFFCIVIHRLSGHGGHEVGLFDVIYVDFKALKKRKVNRILKLI